MLDTAVRVVPVARPFRVRARVRRRIIALASLALKLVAVFALINFARSMLADQYEVPTGSMVPTIAPGDRIVVDKTAYGLRLPFTDLWLFRRTAPSAGDVVLFTDPRGGPIPLVKRVVAGAGQTVAMRGGTLYVDGNPQRLEQMPDGRTVEHLAGGVHEEGTRDYEDFGPMVVEAGHFFVMGDNRAASLDSRFLGAVPRDLLRGRVIGISYNYDGAHVSRLMRPLDRAAAVTR